MAPHLLPLTLFFSFFLLWHTQYSKNDYSSSFRLLSLSLSVSHLCLRCMKGHNHRCHTHTHTRLKIMRLFWEYYNAGNNTDNDDDNFTTSVTFFDRTGWVFGACVLRKFWKSWSKKCDLCGKCELWSLCFFLSGRQPEAQEWTVCESLLYGSCCEVPLRSLDDT